MNLTHALGGAAVSAVLLLGLGGIAVADSGGVDTREEALQAITDGLALIDTGQGKVAAGRDWLAANPAAEPPAEEPPAAGEVTATATVVDDRRARVDWTSTRAGVTGWRIARDGTDTSGTGPWATELPAAARTFTFDLLRAGATYRFTLTGHTAAGDIPPVVAEVTMRGATPPPATTPPPTTPPPAGTGTEAATKFGWGTPIAAGSDEFNYVGAPGSKWHQAGECWPANGTVVQGRCASRATVDGNKLVMDGRADGKAPWVAAKFGQRYGKWEARVRSYHTAGNNGRTWHPLLIIWPDSDRWPQDGEYDFLENGAPGQQCAESFIHFPHNPGTTQQQFKRETNCGAPLSEWHNVAFEWTPQHVKGFIDGVEWFSYSGGANSTRRNIQDMPSGHLTIQLDNFTGTNMSPAKYEVDWVRTYSGA